MDGGQFDALARLVSTMQSRRAALAALLGAALLGTTPGLAVAKPKGKGKGKRKRKTTEAGRGRDRGGRRQGAPKGRGQAKRRQDRGQLQQRRAEPTRTTQAEAVSCCGSRTCPLPGPGSQSAACNFTGVNLAGLDLTDAHFGKITGTGVVFSGADARGASFGAACLNEAQFVGTNLNQEK
jgi:hypothetical protein